VDVATQEPDLRVVVAVVMIQDSRPVQVVELIKAGRLIDPATLKVAMHGDPLIDGVAKTATPILDAGLYDLLHIIRDRCFSEHAPEGVAHPAECIIDVVLGEQGSDSVSHLIGRQWLIRMKVHGCFLFGDLDGLDLNSARPDLVDTGGREAPPRNDIAVRVDGTATVAAVLLAAPPELSLSEWRPELNAAVHRVIG
jgi:hypothetical protein